MPKQDVFSASGRCNSPVRSGFTIMADPDATARSIVTCGGSHPGGKEAPDDRRGFGRGPRAEHLKHRADTRALRIPVPAHLEHYVVLPGRREDGKGDGACAFLYDEEFNDERTGCRQAGE